MFAALLYLGLRKGEMAGLRWRDVDFHRQFVTVRRSYAGAPKSGRERDVPMPGPILRDLEGAPPRDAVQRLDAPLPQWRGKDVQSIRPGLQHTLDASLDGAGVPRMTLHKLRHAYASFFVMNGGIIFDLQRNLRDSSVQLASDVYAHLSPDHRLKRCPTPELPRAAAAGVSARLR